MSATEAGAGTSDRAMETTDIDKRQRMRLGALVLIGLGVAMYLHQVVPHELHGALSIATVALIFGALYTLAGTRFRWARMPALVLSALSGWVFLMSLPGVSWKMWWPLLLVVAGLWILRKERRLVF